MSHTIVISVKDDAAREELLKHENVRHSGPARRGNVLEVRKVTRSSTLKSGGITLTFDSDEELEVWEHDGRKTPKVSPDIQIYSTYDEDRQ